jgi:hypothetical protein
MSTDVEVRPTPPAWPGWADGLIASIRSEAGPAPWDDATTVIRRAELTTEQAGFLLTLGLAELLAWDRRLEVDGHASCMGEAMARSRYPGLERNARSHNEAGRVG